MFIHSEYKTESLNKATFRTYDAKDALPEMFPKVRDISEELNGYINGFQVKHFNGDNNCQCLTLHN